MPIRPLPNEQHLLARVAMGDVQAFQKLFNAYYQGLGAFVLKLTDQPPIAQEIVQDTFVKVWENRAQLKKVENFHNYLFVICRNRSYNALRQLAHEARSKADFQYFEIQKSLEPDEENIKSYRTWLNESIDKLPPQAQKVYLMSRDERLKYHEIAERLNISPETVKKHIQFALKFIKADLNNKLPEAILLVLCSSLVLS